MIGMAMLATTSVVIIGSSTYTLHNGGGNGGGGGGGPTDPVGTTYQAYGTYYTGINYPYGNCGAPETTFDDYGHVALNIYKILNDNPSLPITDPTRTGFYNNGLNCGRYMKITLGRYCDGTNHGTPDAAGCTGGAVGWGDDEFSGAEMIAIVADSCPD